MPHIIHIFGASGSGTTTLAREIFARFGNRIYEGGDMYEEHIKFLLWASKYDTADASMRSKMKHDEWQKLLSCPIITVDGTDRPEINFKKIFKL